MKTSILTYLTGAYCILLMIAPIETVRAQPPQATFDYVQKYESVPNVVFESRRQRLSEQLDESMIALVFAADKKVRQNDVHYEYRQNSNLLYLTGIETDNVILVLLNDGAQTRELAFCKERNTREEVWGGLRPGIEGVKQRGIADVRPIETFSSFMDSVLTEEWIVCVESNLPTNIVVNPVSQEPLYMSEAARTYLREQWPNIGYNTSIVQRAVGNMRAVKDTTEIRLLQTAIDITGASLVDMMKIVEDGMTEHRLRAEIEYGFAKRGAQYEGFPSIVGAGNNTCIVHYTESTDTAHNDELLLVDCGAEYSGYTADVTRTIPVNGTFDEEQTLIYELVLRAQDSAIAACVPGAQFRDPSRVANRIIGDGLLELGITTSRDQTRWYFPHGTSHYLGLDVHDVITAYTLQPGTVLTVEPGIYIPEGSPCDEKWWGIGVRIEDDILVGATQPENLSAHIPRTIQEIETIMQED